MMAERDPANVMRSAFKKLTQEAYLLPGGFCILEASRGEKQFEELPLESAQFPLQVLSWGSGLCRHQ